jgi:hypothetical protein
MQPSSWEFRSLEDVEDFWTEFRAVLMRSEGREHRDEELYAAALYLLLLGRPGLLAFPFRLDKSEAPDFILGCPSGKVYGLEVSRATTTQFQREMTELDKEYSRREREAARRGIEPEPVMRGYDLPPDEERVRNWCDRVLAAIRQKLEKLPKFQQAADHDLLICKDADVPLFPGRERDQALEMLAAELRQFEASFGRRFRTVSLILSLDVEHDIGRNRKLLSYREKEA